MEEEDSFKFGESGYETIRNVLMALIADHVDADETPDENHALEEVERFVGALPSLYRMGVVWVLRGLEVAPYAMGYRSQFSNLAREDQINVLDSFEKSSNYIQRGIVMLLKSMLLLLYFSEPEMERALGYDHRCLLEVRGGSGGS